MDRTTRLIIYNQLEILKHLNPGQKQAYERRQQALESGYSTRYDDVLEPISTDEVSEDLQQEVWNTLEMFRALHNCKARGWHPSNPQRAVFEGYDANNDEQYFFASHLLDVCGLYQESSPNRNSHSMATAERFRRMVAKWLGTEDRFNISPQEAEEITSA